MLYDFLLKISQKVFFWFKEWFKEWFSKKKQSSNHWYQWCSKNMGGV